MQEAQAYLTKKLREPDLGRDLEGAKINEYLDRWLETAVKPRVRQKTWQDYDGILRRYIAFSIVSAAAKIPEAHWSAEPERLRSVYVTKLTGHKARVL